MRRVAALAVALATLAAAAPAHAQAGGDLCLTDPVLPAARTPHEVRFGITPEAAGSAGAVQQAPVPFDATRTDAALLALRPPGRELVVRLNRLFETDGEAGIARFAAQVDRFAALGLRTEVQVRYRGRPLDDWAAFVRRAVTVLGARRSVVAFSITNEANFPVSPNTSDGVYDDARPAIVRGVLAGRAALDAIGRTDVPVGFTIAWRYAPNSDRQFFRDLGTLGGKPFAAALGYVGVQLYPGLVWPPVRRPGVSAGEEVTEALALVRTCLMPQAGLGDAVRLWVTEVGYATNLGRDEAQQEADLRSTVDAVHGVSGTLGVDDLRWFNLRDNDSDGTDLFSAVGLLRDDYSEKPAFGALRSAIAAVGTPEPTVRRTCVPSTGKLVLRRGDVRVWRSRRRSLLACRVGRTRQVRLRAYRRGTLRVRGTTVSWRDRSERRHRTRL